MELNALFIKKTKKMNGGLSKQNVNLLRLLSCHAIGYDSSSKFFKFKNHFGVQIRKQIDA